MGKQRFQCLRCLRTFIWRARYNHFLRSQHWFKLWVTENCSIRLLSKLSGYSASKLHAIKNYWLKQTPEEHFDYSKFQYLVYDATYFHKDICLLNLMNATDQKIIAHILVKKESFKDALPWFTSLSQQGLKPLFITTDGERSIMRAMKLVWPEVKLQRCLYHIQHEGMRWLRTCPKTVSGKQLRTILAKLSSIKTVKERESFINEYTSWLDNNRDFVRSQPRNTVAAKDLCRTMVLIGNALPDMFYYLDKPIVYSTTNALEGFHSRLKTDYQRHRGLTKEHRNQFIHWYCYFHNA